MKWRHAVTIRDGRLCSRGQQGFHRLEVVPVGRPLQRRRSIDVRRVHVDALPNERACGRGLLVLERGDKTQVRLRTGR